MGEYKANIVLGNLALALESRPIGRMPSGIAGIEFPRGAISEITGPPSSGRSTVAYSTLAHATARGEACAFIDATDALNPAAAAAAGARLEQLLWIRVNGHLEHTLKAADLLIHAGGFGLIVL